MADPRTGAEEYLARRLDDPDDSIGFLTDEQAELAREALFGTSLERGMREASEGKLTGPVSFGEFLDDAED